jgi:hypothetical protein
MQYCSTVHLNHECNPSFMAHSQRVHNNQAPGLTGPGSVALTLASRTCRNRTSTQLPVCQFLFLCALGLCDATSLL